MRPPRIRVLRKARRLACGHIGAPGDVVASKGHGWLCGSCQPWIPLRTHEQVLAEYRDRTD
jgi:hypothetical protein